MPEKSAESRSRKCWIGFDLGGTKMLCHVYDDDYKLLGRGRKKTKAANGSDFGLKRMTDLIRSTLEDAERSPDDLLGIGIGCPGPIDMADGTLLSPPNLGWEHTPVKAYLAEQFECPIAVLNDVDAGVYAEYLFGAAKDANCVIGVFPGTGIGGGCVYRGEILWGRGLSCGEIGHIQIMADGPLCGCGQRGCLEAMAGRLAISAEVAKAAKRGEAPYVLEHAGTDLANIRSGVLAGAVKAGDKVVEEILRDAGREIGVAVAGMINMLAPDVVVLGGGLVEAMPDLFVKEVTKSARNRVMEPYRDVFRVEAAALADDASVLGAAAWGRKCIQGERREES